jgi:aspartyl protease family protein
MTRPIVWALGTMATIAISATAAGDRIAARLGAAPSPRPQVQAQPRIAAAEAPRGASRQVAVAADLRGHFLVHPTVDGRRVRMLVDTGASLIALTHEDARAAGIQVFPGDFKHRVSTANGIVAAAPVRLNEVRIGDISVRNVEAVVMPPGKLGTSLLGMSFLKRLQGFEIAQGRLILKG